MIFDPTINLGQLLTLGGGILAFLKMSIDMRDMLKRHDRDIKQLQETSDMHEDKIEAHNTWLVRAGLDQRSGTERRRRVAENDSDKQL